MAVRRGVLHISRGDTAAGAGAVVDHDALTHVARDRLREDARIDIGAASGAKADHEGDGTLLREILRHSLSGERQSAGRRQQKPPAHHVVTSPLGYVEPFAEMREGAGVRHLGHRRIVGVRPAVIGERMNHARIDERLHIGIVLDGRQDLALQQFRRRGVIELAEMQDQRLADVFALVGEKVNARAVIADRCLGVGARCREIRHRATEAEAGHADLAVAFRPRAQE